MERQCAICSRILPKENALYCSLECKGKARFLGTIKEIETRTGFVLSHWIEQSYNKEFKGVREISKILDINTRTTTKIIKHFGIELRHGSNAIKAQWMKNEERKKQQGQVFKETHKGTISPRRLTDEEVYDRLLIDNLTFIKTEVIDGYSYYSYICNECGYIGVKSSKNINRTGCPSCNTNSKGEKEIAKWLKDNRIKHKTQFKIEECRNIKPLPFDFALFNGRKLIYLIEYDGIQHFKPSERFGGEEGFIKRKMHDNIKNEYCKSRNINLIRIPYWEFDNIDSILEKIIS